MHSQTKSLATRSRKNLPRFVSAEYILFTKHIAVFGEFLLRYSRQHLVGEQRNVFTTPASIFGRNTVCSKKRWHVAQRSLFIQLLDRTQNFDFIFQRQS